MHYIATVGGVIAAVKMQLDASRAFESLDRSASLGDWLTVRLFPLSAKPSDFTGDGWKYYRRVRGWFVLFVIALLFSAGAT